MEALSGSQSLEGLIQSRKVAKWAGCCAKTLLAQDKRKPPNGARRMVHFGTEPQIALYSRDSSIVLSSGPSIVHFPLLSSSSDAEQVWTFLRNPSPFTRACTVAFAPQEAIPQK